MTIISAKKNAEHYLWGQNCDGWRLLDSPGLSVIEEQMPANTSEVLHYHHQTQQVFYILSGMATFQLDGEIMQVTANESIHVPCKMLHKISNEQTASLHFLLVSEPTSHADRIDIIAYTDENKEAIRTLNIEWLEKYFKVEPVDRIMLADPASEIIDKGGQIFYARKGGEIVGTYSLLRIHDKEFEAGKMAVTEASQGLGIGNMLMKHCLLTARQKNVEKLILYSNTKLASAIHLYKKFGFKEVPMEAGHYERANIKMEKLL